MPESFPTIARQRAWCPDCGALFEAVPWAQPGIADIASQMGHNMVMSLSVYGHVFAEADGGARISAEEAIRLARASDVSVLCPLEAEPPVAEEA